MYYSGYNFRTLALASSLVMYVQSIIQHLVKIDRVYWSGVKLITFDIHRRLLCADAFIHLTSDQSPF
jgi:hypothetical protein